MDSNNKEQIHNFWLVGVNHKKCDASVRGMFSINSLQYDQILFLAAKSGIKNIFIISTCNRTEIYSFADSAEQLMDFICKVTVGDLETLKSVAYIKNGLNTIEHLFQVAAGLDSQILGDFEILGQIKNSIKFSKGRGFIGNTMERIINCVYQSSKSVKTNTAISGGTVSTSFAAVQCIKENTTEINTKKILLVGTGKIGKATCKNVVDYLGVNNIVLMNRTEETAINLANEMNLKWSSFSNLDKEILSADVIIVSTGASEPIIYKNQLKCCDNKLIIDLSVPRNVDLEVKELSNITLVDVDLLSKVKDETLQNRKAEVPKAIAIIKEHIAEFMEWYNMRKYVPVIKEVKDKLKEIYIAPSLKNFTTLPIETEQEETIKKIVNSFAAKMRRNNTIGCYYLEAINDYIGYNG